MMEPSARAAWTAFKRQAEAEGLNVRMVRTRKAVESAFAAASGSAASPAVFHPTYRRAVLLGSAGTPLWERFRAAGPDGGTAHPLDRYTERAVERVLAALRGVDAGAVAVYPFSHARRIVPFLAFLQDTSLLRMTPFGVGVHARFGPWFAWRAAVLTSLPLPASALPTKNTAAESPRQESPCVACPAPCTDACPAGVVAKAGFGWQGCVDFRVREAPCRATCLAREACPVGAEFRYAPEQMAYHYEVSLRTILAEGWARGRDKS